MSSGAEIIGGWMASKTQAAGALALVSGRNPTPFLPPRLIKMTPPHGTSQAVQWLRLCAPNAGSTGSIPCRGNKILHATQAWPKEKKKDDTPSDLGPNPDPPFT